MAVAYNEHTNYKQNLNCIHCFIIIEILGRCIEHTCHKQIFKNCATLNCLLLKTIVIKCRFSLFLIFNIRLVHTVHRGVASPFHSTIYFNVYTAAVLFTSNI